MQLQDSAHKEKAQGRFRFSSQLYALFVISVTIIAAGLVFALATLTVVRQDLNEISTSHLELISRALELAERTGTLSAMTSSLVGAKSIASHESAYRAVRDRTEQLNTDIDQLEGMDVDHELWATLNVTVVEFSVLAAQIGENSSQRTQVRDELTHQLQELEAILRRPGQHRLTQDDHRAVTLIQLLFAAQTQNAYHRWERNLSPLLSGLLDTSPIKEFAQPEALSLRSQELRLDAVLDGQIAHFKRLADRMIYIANEIYFQSRNKALEISHQTNDILAWRMPLLIGTLMLTALVVLLTWMFIHTRLVKPLNKLYDEVQAHAAGDHTDFDVHGPLEIKRVAQMLDASTKDAKKREADVLSALSEAKLANQSKSQFLAAASHDLRQPLQAIKLFCEVLRSGLASKALDSAEKNLFFLDNIEQAIGGLGELLNALLDMSKLEANIVKKDISVFAIDDVLLHVTKTYSTFAGDRGVKLTVVPSSYHVKSDPILLKQIVDNLVSNAVRYSEGGRVVVGCRKHENMLRLEVCDNGVGIPRDEQERIFDDFYQLNNPGRQRAKGLGLGLSIVRRTAEILEHPISLTSTPDAGSIFSLLIPLDADPKSLVLRPKLKLDDTKPSLNGLVWLAEDDAAVRSAMKLLLNSWGVRVIAMSSAHETMLLAIKTQKLPDLLLFDYQLDEKMNGLELFQTCTAQWGKEVPCIILSGNTLPADLDKISQSKVDLLTKPVSAQELLAKIQPILS
ncbi:hybrid sensor histidine kinase/response regulator [Magnetovibrio sp. PR-2]|uniref:ATP-binding response regulator n=1 Tax=Magnetovibrio sp. PR-2 TaxID=3120356 RepID=UPI002FCE5538